MSVSLSQESFAVAWKTQGVDTRGSREFRQGIDPQAEEFSLKKLYLKNRLDNSFLPFS